MIETTVSVIIPVYNGAMLLKRCLDSVFAQRISYRLDVIVIDDGSTDNSVALVRSYNQVILLQQINQGPAMARNRGIDAANGKYVAFLDADDYWLPDFLKETVDFMEKYKNAIAVSVGQMIKIPGKPNIVSPFVLKSDPERYSEAILLSDFFEFWAQHNHLLTGSVLMRTDTLKLTGGQRPELRITEDLEFWAYLATFGQWGFIPKVLYVADGWPLTKQIGWLEKNKIRWSSAPSVETWESRIVLRMEQPLLRGYLSVRGWIAGNLAYSMILSSRDNQARETIKKYRRYLKKNKLNLLLIVASKNFLIWKVVCQLLRKREYSR